MSRPPSSTSTSGAVPAAGRRHHDTRDHGLPRPECGAGHPSASASRAPEPAGRSGFFADSEADFDGAATDELVRTVGLLLGACGSEGQLAHLARELADTVERRDARVVIDQLRWRLDVLAALHDRARPEGVRHPR